MITIGLNGKTLEVKFNDCPMQAFSTARILMKSLHCLYNSKTTAWEAPYYRYDEIKDSISDALDELDTIVDKVDRTEYDSLVEGVPEQEFCKTRRIPDYSLMTFPPMKGKPPYENFQSKGISQGINRSRYAYFWQMGTGKSYVASALIAHRLMKYHDVGKVLFMTTSIGVRNLKHEICKFVKDLDPDRIAIADKNNRKPFDDKDVDIIITSYNSFRLVCDAYKKEYKIKSKEPRKPFLPIKEWSGGKDCMLILDESHEIMYTTSQRGHLVALHSPEFRYRYLFSGTPADSPEKLYNQFKTLDPWLVYNLSFTQWKEKMAVLGDRFSPYAVREWKRDELEKSNERFLRNHGNYYKTEDLLDLPDYNEKKIYLTMNPRHRAIYQALVMDDVAKNNSGSSRDIINRFPYMMLAVDNPFLLEKHEEKFSPELTRMLKEFKESYMEKFDAVEDIISDHPNEKILIWAEHPLTIEMLGKRFSKLNPITIMGSTKQEERNDLVEKFKTSKENKLLIANIMTLNTSATITEATVQIYVERGFSYSPYHQSTRRIYRIGQTRDVTTYILIYDHSLDNLVDKNLTSKGMLVQGLVKKDFLTQEEWAKIFNLSETDDMEGYNDRDELEFQW